VKVKNLLWKMWNEENGVLTFEWTLLLTILVIGVVSGLAGVRDAIIDELGDFAQAAVAVDQSYTIANPLFLVVHDITEESAASDSGFQDAAIYQDCTRLGVATQQATTSDVDS
jgi:Flp pilus assembly pilin Flp